MIRFSIPWLIDTIKTIDTIDSITIDTESAEKASILYSVQFRIIHLYINTFYKDYLKTSSNQANELYYLIDESLKPENDSNEILTLMNLNKIKEKKREFSTTLISELGVLPTYIAMPKEAYDVDRVINDGAVLFPPNILNKVPNAKSDLMEAGKALAFELSTACGFHIFRAVECVVRRYWQIVSADSPLPSPATIGNIAAEMEKLKIGTKIVVESLKQLSRLHRNPTIHPENYLNTEEAINIIGISRSSVSAMLLEIPDMIVENGE